jgi:ABC-type multidrug transport system fused ATPase/permease subunit
VLHDSYYPYLYNIINHIQYVYISIIILYIANHRLGTSEKLHKDVLQRILNAPVAFFDVTPLGRILNRFSSDMLTIDEELSQTINQLSNSVFQLIGGIAAVSAATKGTFLILMVPLAYFYYQVQKMFRKTNTTVARLEAVSRS